MTDEYWCEDCGDYHGRTPRPVGAFGGVAPTTAAIDEERRAIEAGLAPLKAIPGVDCIEVDVASTLTETHSEVRWMRGGVPHALRAAFGQGRDLARAVVLSARRTP